MAEIGRSKTATRRKITQKPVQNNNQKAQNNNQPTAQRLEQKPEQKPDQQLEQSRTSNWNKSRSILSSKDPAKDSAYHLVWQDEFEGTALDRSDWNVELHDPGWVNSELQAYVDTEKNIYVKDGKLIIQPEKTEQDGKVSYTSGRVNTQGKKDFKYGYF
ncbi:MAG: hypothetical protein ACLVCH_07015 [Roseburia inulinivorans]